MARKKKTSKGVAPGSPGTESARLRSGGLKSAGTGTESARLRSGGLKSAGTGTESARLKAVASSKKANVIGGVWERAGTGTETGSAVGVGTQTLKLVTLPGTRDELQNGEERTMKVRLSKVKVKGKTVLKLSLEG